MESTNPDAGSLTPVFAFYGGVIAVPLVILAVLVTVVASLHFLLGILLILIALAVAAYLTYRRYASADEILLDELDVVDADESEHARAYNLLESLSLRSGVAAPGLYLTDDQSVNALAIQQSKDAAAVITSGAATRLDRLQLEGLLAEVIARISSDDARRATIATAMMMPFTSGPLRFLGRFASGIFERSLNADRELQGDLGAVNLTRYPPGLRDALTIANEQSDVGPAAASRLWVVPPSSHSPRYDLSVRLAAINEF